ncbi:MAG TPA: hypothetical protein VK856_11180 [Anaerolineaceae bacterium]|nr:hypothetical protein [Anaerolineaceae bacterium]
MNDQKRWLNRRIRIGWFFVGLGILFVLVGVYFEIYYSYIPYNVSIITGLGILWAGIGIGLIVRYMAGKKGEESAKRLMVEELDERNQLIRYRAGYRGFWVAIILVYIVLMWLSMAANGSLPPVGEELLWYFQVVCVVIPFSVYIISFIVDQKKL